MKKNIEKYHKNQFYRIKSKQIVLIQNSYAKNAKKDQKIKNRLKLRRKPRNQNDKNIKRIEKYK